MLRERQGLSLAGFFSGFTKMIVIVVMCGLVAIGCNSNSKGGNGGGGIGPVTTATTATAGIAGKFFRWSYTKQYVLDVDKTKVKTDTSKLKDPHARLLLLASDNASFTVATIQGNDVLDSNGKEVWRFLLEPNQSNANFLVEVVITDGSVVQETVDLSDDPYSLTDADGIGHHLGIRFQNGTVFRLGTMSVPGLSGTNWPFKDGDRMFGVSWNKSSGKYRLFVRPPQSVSGSPKLSVGALTATGSDGWFQTDELTMPDTPTDKPQTISLQDGTGKQIDLTGCEFANASGQIEVRFDAGLMYPPSFDRHNPTAVRLDPVWLRLAANGSANSSTQLELLAELEFGNQDLTLRVTDLSTNWTSTDGTIAAVSDTGLATGKSIGSAVIQSAFAGHPSNLVSVTVGTRQLKSITISGPNSVSIGGHAAYTAQAGFDDGTTSDATSAVTFVSGQPNNASFSNAVLTGLTAGTTDVTATSATLVSNKITVTVSGSGGSPPPPPPPGSPTIVLTKVGALTEIADGGAVDFSITMTSDGTTAATFVAPVLTVNDNTLVTVTLVGQNAHVVAKPLTLNGGVIRVTATATINGTATTGKSAEFMIYGERGIDITGRMYVLVSEADVSLNKGTPTGTPEVIGELTNWTANPQVTTTDTITSSASLQYYRTQQNAGALRSATYRWDIRKHNLALTGSDPNNYFPEASTPNAADVEKDANGTRFFHKVADSVP